MHFVLFDDQLIWKNLLPLTFTRPVSEIRLGILTIKQKWDKYLNSNCSYKCESYLQAKFPLSDHSNACCINSSVLPDKQLVEAILQLSEGDALLKDNLLLAFKGPIESLTEAKILKRINYAGEPFQIKNTWDIFQKNEIAIKQDFELLTNGRTSEPLSKTVTVIGNSQLVFLEKGAKAEACILNTNNGPVYLGGDSEIMEGAVVRGPFALCEHSALKLSTKIYGATTIGPHSKVGGEVNNSVVFGYSNKAHDGFLGNSVVGEWCNLGADTNNSNLKNNYSNVKLYNYQHKKAIDTGLQFCGLIMGDYSKSGINTMFNTGTVVGVACNIYGGGFPPTHLPDFSWGGSEGLENYNLEKLFETTERVYARRGLIFGDTEKNILRAIKSQL
ncbi:MAG: GlmU family protein [Bacteroidia bacterium]|nr:GlmU family protein [Bacteroidia bacterium]